METQARKGLPPVIEIVDLSLIRRLMGPAMLGMVGMVGMLPGMFGSGGIPEMFDMLGMGGMGAPLAEGGSCPPPGDLTADTSADIETDTWETPKFGGGWLIRAFGRLNFGILEPVCKKQCGVRRNTFAIICTITESWTFFLGKLQRSARRTCLFRGAILWRIFRAGSNLCRG